MFVTCVNSRAHSMSASKRKATVTRRNISSFKVHLTRQLFVFPPADAAHHLTAASHHSSNRVLDPPPPSMAGCSWLQCLLLTSPDSGLSRLRFELHSGSSTGDCFPVVPPAPFIGFHTFASFAKALRLCINRLDT